MTADVAAYLERLAAEEWPDGSFGGARPTHPDGTIRRPDPRAAEHYAELAAALYPRRKQPPALAAIEETTRPPEGGRSP